MKTLRVSEEQALSRTLELLLCKTQESKEIFEEEITPQLRIVIPILLKNLVESISLSSQKYRNFRKINDDLKTIFEEGYVKEFNIQVNYITGNTTNKLKLEIQMNLLLSSNFTQYANSGNDPYNLKLLTHVAAIEHSLSLLKQEGSK